MGGHSFLAKAGAFSVAMHQWLMRKPLMGGALKVAKPIKKDEANSPYLTRLPDKSSQSASFRTGVGFRDTTHVCTHSSICSISASLPYYPTYLLSFKSPLCTL